MPQSIHSFRKLFLLTCFLALSGCSSTRLAYSNLNWLTIWAVEDYVALDEAQEEDLKQALELHLEWHCRTQLPAYVRWLDAIATTIESRKFDQARIAGHYADLFDFVARAGEEITPTAARVLASLDNRQVAELSDSFHERNQELQEEYLDPPLPQQIEQRAKRLEDRLERWLGDLSVEQRDFVATWAIQRGDQNRVWLEGREAWQTALMESLKGRQAPGFDQQVALLLTDPGRFKPAEYQARMAEGRDQIIQLTQQLLAVSSERQLVQLQEELASLSAELQSLVCEGSLQ